jgi:GT2 family glycosyltransferase
MRSRIIIVNWRNATLTLRAAASVAPQLREGDRLVLVDNGSGDGSARRLRESGYEVVALPRNRGFGGGVNAGARGMDEDALVLLNNDAVAHDGFLDALLAPLRNPEGRRIGATTGRILLSGRWEPANPATRDALVNREGRRWHRAHDGGVELVNSTGNLVDASGNGYDRDFLEPADGSDADPEVFGLCGGACAIRREAWEQVGAFREDLFMYYEDTELSWRLREAGWDVRYAAGAVTSHDHAASSGTLSPLFIRCNVRNRIVVAALHGPTSMVVQAVARTVVRILRGPDRVPAARGLAEALRRLPDARRQRRAAMRGYQGRCARRDSSRDRVNAHSQAPSSIHPSSR